MNPDDLKSGYKNLVTSLIIGLVSLFYPLLIKLRMQMDRRLVRRMYVMEEFPVQSFIRIKCLI